MGRRIWGMSELGFENVVIHGYDHLYYVSPDGKITSLSYIDKSGKLRKERILSQTIRGKGYKCVGLMREGKQVHVSVHRLVAEAFIPNPQNKPQVNHIDGNKENNNASNLEWVTNQENALHAFREKIRIPAFRAGEECPSAKLKNTDIIYIRNSGESVKCLAEKFNVTVSAIYKIKQKKNWKHV